MAERPNGRRVIEVGKTILGPAEPRPRTVRAKQVGDFPGVAPVYLEVARKLSSPLVMGPPLCDELVELVRHVFTEEEAAVVRHLGAYVGTTAEELARAEHRPLDEVAPILERLAVVKRAIAASGPEERQKYRLMPIMPGIFEMVLIGESPEGLSPWHRRFAELFEALYETGYFGQYLEGQRKPAPLVRFLPVGRVIEAHPMALPSDRLEVLLDRYQTFGLGQCQCRMAMQVTGRGCGKPTRNCTVMGQWAEQGIRGGWLQPVTKEEVLRVKREAEEQGMVNWVMNVEATRGQASCSCCGCCCHAMRMVNEFNAPAAIAPPHFLPRFDAARCTYCGKCVKHCPMGALAMDLEAKTRDHRLPRCIGCGLCAVACGDRGAVAMEPVPDHKLPYKSWFSLLLHAGPGMLKTAWNVWWSR